MVTMPVVSWGELLQVGTPPGITGDERLQTGELTKYGERLQIEIRRGISWGGNSNKQAMRRMDEWKFTCGNTSTMSPFVNKNRW